MIANNPIVNLTQQGMSLLKENKALKAEKAALEAENDTLRAALSEPPRARTKTLTTCGEDLLEALEMIAAARETLPDLVERLVGLRADLVCDGRKMAEAGVVSYVVNELENLERELTPKLRVTTGASDGEA